MSTAETKQAFTLPEVLWSPQPTEGTECGRDDHQPETEGQVDSNLRQKFMDVLGDDQEKHHHNSETGKVHAETHKSPEDVRTFYEETGIIGRKKAPS